MAQVPVKFYRQAIIYKNISQKNYISLFELVNQVQEELLENGYSHGISQRSIQRDIQEMNSTWISIQYDKYHKGYYIPTDEVIAPILESLLEHVRLFPVLQRSKEITGYILPEQRAITGILYLPPLVQALEKNLVVEFDYQKFSEMEFTRRSVEPHFLKEFSGRWYLLAKESGDSTMKTWGLDRVRNLSITREQFLRDTLFDPQEYYKDTFGIYTTNGLQAEEIILSFTPKGGQYILTRPLHPSQVVLIDNDEEVRIKIKVKLTNDFIMELLSHTDKMTIIKPRHLQERFQNLYQQAIQRLVSNMTDGNI